MVAALFGPGDAPRLDADVAEVVARSLSDVDLVADRAALEAGILASLADPAAMAAKREAKEVRKARRVSGALAKAQASAADSLARAIAAAETAAARALREDGARVALSEAAAAKRAAATSKKRGEIAARLPGRRTRRPRPKQKRGRRRLNEEAARHWQAAPDTFGARTNG